MDRAAIEQHLAQAERHVMEGESRLVRQRKIVTKLADQGSILELAQELLKQFEVVQVSHIADRNRLRAALATF